ncbi:restriction endonuclease subunit M [Uruburuella testudinis]|uniref:Restriction endonuclease subunit M n=1 Tax=Uruburuella testudinis TaxID=1282863 RepID=A0ABY4DRX6_9NEIS|nr:restriction endonuclease subunit M [Uruburuella testudinis]UOO81781.1 restriction endonuclease subunit M [Uruburuella testudinis]
MTTLTELTHKLENIFQIDRADLDFGIYRILNSRSREISSYLNQTLPKAVQSAFAERHAAALEQWQQELDNLIQTLQAAGVAPDTSPKVHDLKHKIQTASQASSADETAVYNHLYTFFSRYYDEGDFISQRRYKGDTYAVPYSGEEVLLHWANKDQYYTKSGENFSNYRFALGDDRQVFFRLVNADTAKDNRKDNNAKRVFALADYRAAEMDDDGEIISDEVLPISETDNGQTLQICFVYRAADKNAKQDDFSRQAIESILADSRVDVEWRDALNKHAPTAKNPTRTLLEKHLSHYTQKNSADYFIHKDLGGFLTRELDFYIKNEVMQLDNIQSADSFARIERGLRLIQTLRRIAHDIIAFLAQLENFQKKLWLKKKFVTAGSYLITLNQIPAKLLDTVFANAKQLEAWKNLFAFKQLPPPRFNFCC